MPTTTEAERPSKTRRGWVGPTAIAAIVLAVHSVLIVAGINELGTLAVNVGVAAGLLVWARRSRSLDNRALGVDLRRSSLRPAVVIAVSVVALAGAAGVLGLLPPVPLNSRPEPLDSMFRLFVAIPIGTAVCEEVIFRGVFLAAWDRLLRPWASIVVVSALFGIWHVAAEAQRVGGLSVAVIPAVVATAAASALLLCPLRRRYGDLSTPIALHAATNMSIYALTTFVPAAHS